MSLPKYDDLFNPLLQALHELGGSASIPELDEKVADILKLSNGDINRIHDGSRTELNYRSAWARNYLKRYGLLENSKRGVWSLTTKGLSVKKVNKLDVYKYVKLQDKKSNVNNNDINNEQIDEWKNQLLNILKNISPTEFERLCQRVLREAGFVKVVVTGKSGDGGIDGTGIIKIGGFLSFRVIFQCKRYQGSISSQQIREFKGTMVGRADKGLFITTGTFSREAMLEANRDGSTSIDLIDGQELVQKMKDLNLGVNVATEEVVTINKDWFNNF